MRFLIDMPLSPSLRTQGHDAVHASDISLQRAPDTHILALAKAEARTIVTADRAYPHLLALARAVEPSLILFRSGDWSDAAVEHRMREVLSALAEAEIAQSIVVVEHDRIRRRRLPIAS
jgi:predicted nuclease of predicted toxin-antitoxin system